MLSAWLLYGLEPARANRRRGLQGGASPRLLPAAFPKHRSRVASRLKESPAQASKLGDAGSLALSLGELMPSDHILERSEFLEPLEEDTRELIRDLLVHP